MPVPVSDKLLPDMAVAVFWLPNRWVVPVALVIVIELWPLPELIEVKPLPATMISLPKPVIVDDVSPPIRVQ